MNTLITEKQDVNLGWLEGLTQRKSLTEAARITGISSSTISRLLAGKYKGDVSGMMSRVAAARENEMSRTALAGSVCYIETSLAKSVVSECDFTRVFARLNRVIGYSQIGKTTALEEYTRTHEDTYMVTLHAGCTMSALIRLLGSAFGVKSHIAPDLALRELAAALTPHSLIIVDECHQVAHRPSGVMAMEFLRSLHDLSKCGVLLCGTYELDRWMLKGKAADTLVQLVNRGTTTYLKTYPTRSDLEALADSYNMPPMPEDVYDYAFEIIKREGLGPFCRELEQTVYRLQRSGQLATWPNVFDTMRALAERRYEARSDRKR